MSRTTAATVLAGIAALCTGGAVATHDVGWVAAALLLIIAALLVELLGPNSPAEDAYLRNHQAHPKRRNRS